MNRPTVHQSRAYSAAPSATRRAKATGAERLIRRLISRVAGMGEAVRSRTVMRSKTVSVIPCTPKALVPVQVAHGDGMQQGAQSGRALGAEHRLEPRLGAGPADDRSTEPFGAGVGQPQFLAAAV